MITELKKHQRDWAEAQGLEPDHRGYLVDVRSNLFKPMAPRTEAAFKKGSGSELKDTPNRPAKMKALHSSSALAVNFFDFWTEQDKSALQRALSLDMAITSITFEEQFPTGLVICSPR